MSWDHLAILAANAATSIAVLGLISIGLAFTFGLMKVINLAHGEFMMLGAVLTLAYLEFQIPLFVSAILAALSVGVLGVVVERLIIRPLYGKLPSTMLATWGLSLVLLQAANMSFGSMRKGISTPMGSFNIGEYTVLSYHLFLVVVALVLLTGIYLLLSKTSYGRMARAAARYPSMSAAVGIDVKRVNMLTFTIGSTLAGLAGALLAPLVGVVPTMGQAFLADSFVTVIVGGPAVVTGLAASAAVLGAVQAIASNVWAPLIGSAAFLVAAIVLVRVLPNGFSGRAGRDI